MANPSLQIGNGKFAIKENNLLGYSSSGTRFFPIPITMTRATLGTRVNPSGLIEDVELLGSEEVTNGDFATDSDWTKGTGWTIANGIASYDGSSGTQSIGQTGVVDAGKTYKLTLDVVSNEGSGANTIYLGGIVVSTIHLEADSYTFFVTTSSTASLSIFGRSGENFSIDNVSVKEATIDGLARVDYTDGTGSLLVEPQRTNLIPYSEDFSSWNKLAAVVTTNQTTSPSGTLTADKITYDGTTYGRVEQTVAVTNGNTYSWSVYLKNNDLSDVTQVWLGFSQAGQGEFVTITNEWQRYETVQVANGSNEYPRVQFTGTGSLYAWGSQIEEGSYATSYIKTTGSTVTRNQDEYTKTGISDKINSEEGVLFVEMAALTDDETRYITLSDGVLNNNAIRIYYHAADVVFFQKYVGGTRTTNLSTSILTQTDFNKLAVRYNSTTVDVWANGVKILTNADTNAITLGTLNSLKLSQGNTSNPFFGKVKQLQIFKTALTDDELTILTGTSGVHFFPSYASMASDLTYTIE